jgi:hypothetical protein
MRPGEHPFLAVDLKTAVDALYQEPPASPELIRYYLSQLLANLNTTEALVQKNFYSMALTALAFLVLDSGIVPELTVQGVKLERTGILLSAFPVLAAVLNYQAHLRLSFVHDIRTVIALLYGRLHVQFYMGGLDSLLHYPSARHIDAYQTMRLQSLWQQRFLVVSTFLIAMFYRFAPAALISYALWRLHHYTDLPASFFWLLVATCVFFLFRALFVGMDPRPDDPFIYRDSGNVGGARAGEKRV